MCSAIWSYTLWSAEDSFGNAVPSLVGRVEVLIVVILTLSRWSRSEVLGTFNVLLSARSLVMRGQTNEPTLHMGSAHSYAIASVLYTVSFHACRHKMDTVSDRAVGHCSAFRAPRDKILTEMFHGWDHLRSKVRHLQSCTCIGEWSELGISTWCTPCRRVSVCCDVFVLGTPEL